MEFNEFKKSFENLSMNYFNKYFAGQSCIETVYLDQMRDCMKALLITYGKFLLLLDSMSLLKKNTEFYKNCSNTRKSSIENSIACLENLTSEFQEILSTYCEAMTD